MTTKCVSLRGKPVLVPIATSIAELIEFQLSLQRAERTRQLSRDFFDEIYADLIYESVAVCHA